MIAKRKILNCSCGSSFCAARISDSTSKLLWYRIDLLGSNPTPSNGEEGISSLMNRDTVGAKRLFACRSKELTEIEAARFLMGLLPARFKKFTFHFWTLSGVTS